MWKDMRKGELIFIYIIWLISAIIFVFGTFYLFDIGKDAVDSILPSSVVQTSQSDSALSTAVDTAKSAVIPGMKLYEPSVLEFIKSLSH